MSSKATATVIAHYSSSFTLASKLLSPKIRRDIEALYAMVRVADEVVDGAAAAAGCAPDAVAEILDNYERQVLLSLSVPFHTDPVIHAFGNTARKCGFEQAHIVAFLIPCAAISPKPPMIRLSWMSTFTAPLRSSG